MNPSVTLYRSKQRTPSSFVANYSNLSPSCPINPNSKEHEGFVRNTIHPNVLGEVFV